MLEKDTEKRMTQQELDNMAIEAIELGGSPYVQIESPLPTRSQAARLLAANSVEIGMDESRSPEEIVAALGLQAVSGEVKV